ncbi:MAG TPA: multiheme c-type cytochrome, partial [Flavobacteriales bacterium]|nr:multiheme c-type cytochrome [Flavobacteriales bacterium]
HQQIRAWGYQSNTLFSAAGICSQCHGYDIDQLASVDAMGNDVNVMDAWAGTIMANSAKDPLWKAKVSHEVLVNPAHQNALESTCVKCHAPLGKYNALHLSQPYGMTELSTDSVGLDGVSCGACHQQRDTLIGKRFSGELFFTTDKTVYGPYTNPLGPMAGNTGFTPTYSPHINRAGLCAGCHTLITQTSDLSGNLTGDHFIEQATYHEWLNSRFNNDIPNPQGISCQGCHIPRINDPVKLSTGPPNLTRTPFGKHELVGANVFMLKLMKDNATALGLYSTARQLDSSIVR